MFEEEVQLLKVDADKIEELEGKLENSYFVSEWIRLLSMYKLNENWRKVEETVERMHHRFHLREAFWVRETQQKIARNSSAGREGVKDVIALFERGLEHGNYADLAQKYTAFLLTAYQQNQLSLASAEEKMEKLIAAFAHDPAIGSLFFNRLRKLYKVKTTPEEVIKTRRAYQRELVLPFESVDVVLDEYRGWQPDEEQLAKIEASYEAVKDRLDTLLSDIKEQRIDKLPPKCALSLMEQQYKFDEQVYLEVLRNLPAEQQLLILRRHSKDGRFFQEYLRELTKHHPENEQLINEEYHRFLATCEKRHRNYYERLFLEAIIRRLNKHLITPQSQEYLDAWPNKVVYFREQIRAFIDKSTDNARKFELLSLWADVEAYVIKDLSSVITISKEALQLGGEASYVHYAHRLVALGTVTDALQVLKDGIAHSRFPQPVAKEYLRLHALFGEEQRDEQQSGEGRETNQLKPEPSVVAPTPQKKIHHSPEAEEVQEHKPSPKRSREPDAEAELLNQKIEQEQKRRHHTDSGKTLFVKGFSHEWGDQDVIKLFHEAVNIEDVRIVKDKNHKSKGFGYVEFKSQEAAREACQRYKANPVSNVSVQISRPPKQYAEQRTIFLCGLPASADEAKVRALLSELTDTIDEIRLVRNEEVSKGYCYVQFRSEELKKQAFEKLLHQKLIVDGKRVLIEQCDSSRQRSKKNNQVAFLEGLSYKATPEDIRDFFSFHEIYHINAIEIPHTDTGKSRGIAYIEFERFIDFQKALDLKVGKIRGRDFKILRSDRQITQKKHNNSAGGSYPSDKRPPANGNGGTQQLSNSDFSKLFG